MENLLISEMDKPALIEFYKLKKSEAEDLIEKSRKDLARFDDILNQLLGAATPKNNNPKGDIFKNSPEEQSNSPKGAYDSKWKWLKKIQFILSSKGSLMASEIVDAIMELEEGKGLSRKSTMSSVSSVLSDKSRIGGPFLKNKSDTGEYRYALNSDKIGNAIQGLHFQKQLV